MYPSLLRINVDAGVAIDVGVEVAGDSNEEAAASSGISNVVEP